MTDDQQWEQGLAANLVEATVARAGMTVASDLACSVFARTRFPPGADLRDEMLKLYRFFRQHAAAEQSSASMNDSRQPG